MVLKIYAEKGTLQISKLDAETDWVAHVYWLFYYRRWQYTDSFLYQATKVRVDTKDELKMRRDLPNLWFSLSVF